MFGPVVCVYPRRNPNMMKISLAVAIAAAVPTMPIKMAALIFIES